jgi:hypothetical protein
MHTPTAHSDARAESVPAAVHDGGTPAERETFSSRQLAFMIGVPAAWGILLLFHPTGDADGFYDAIDSNVVPWVTVHLGMGVFVPLFAGAVYLLLRGVQSTAAMVSRIGLVVFAIFYVAWELVLGVGTGLFTEEVNALPEAQKPVGAELVDAYGESGVIAALSYVGSIGLAVALIAAAVALRRVYRLGWAPIALMIVAIPFIAIHEPPFGPVGLALFIAAVLLIARERASVATAGSPPLDRPAPA